VVSPFKITTPDLVVDPTLNVAAATVVLKVTEFTAPSSASTAFNVPAPLIAPV
jgi:hypothetical protein